MTTPEVEKLLKAMKKEFNNPNSISELQWEEIKQRVWKKIKFKINDI